MASASGMELAGVLLSALGRPSSMVLGNKTFLDGPVGALLNSMTPSMMSRRVRESAGTDHGTGAGAGPGRRASGPSLIQLIRQKQANRKTQSTACAKVAWPDTLAGRLRCEHRSAAVSSSCSVSGSRAFSEGIDIPEASRPAESAPPLGWPWEQPLPTEAVPAQSHDGGDFPGPPYVGTIIDLFA